jgi:SSS family solute:Na+ symporter
VDLYEKWKPKRLAARTRAHGPDCHHRHGLIAMAVDSGGQGRAQGLYEYLQSVQGYLAPPIFVVFFFGVFNKRLNAQGLPLGHDRRVCHRESSACSWTHR